MLAVTATGREAEDLAEALGSLLGPDVGRRTIPSWETLPHERLSPRADTVGRRLAVLRRLAHPEEYRRRRRCGSSSRPCAASCSRRPPASAS